MELNKTLMLSTLFSALVLAGCGGGGGGGGGSDADASGGNTGGDNTGGDNTGGDNTGGDNTTDPSFGFNDASSTKISGDIQAAVKAATFVRYEEDVTNYELQYDFVTELSGELGSVVQSLSLLVAAEVIGNGFLPLDNEPYPSQCTEGNLFVSGIYTDFNASADDYCIEVPDTAGDELSLSGGYAVLYANTGDYSITFNEGVIEYDSFDADITDVSAVINTGSIAYLEENETNNELIVLATITSGGVGGEFDFTQTCVESDCSIDANISGAGNEYIVDGLTVTAPNGYTGSADIFYNPVLGELAVSFDQIQYCEDGSIRSGTMNITAIDSTAEIATSFNGCGVEPLVEFYADGTP